MGNKIKVPAYIQVDAIGRVIWTPESQSLVDAEIRKARAEVIEEVREALSKKEVLLYIDPNIGEFIDDSYCVTAVARNDINSVLDKLSEVEK